MTVRPRSIAGRWRRRSSGRPRSAQRLTIVDLEHRAGDEGGLGRAEKADDRVQCLGRHQPLAREAFYLFAAAFRIEPLIVELGLDITGAERVHIDALPDPLAREALAEHHNRGLAGGITPHPPPPPPT